MAMRRFLLDTGIAADYIHRRRDVNERCREAAAYLTLQQTRCGHFSFR